MGRALPCPVLVAALSLVLGHTTAFLLDDPSPLDVLSFNIQRFGRSKMSNPTTANNIVRICQLYDVILILETRDSTGSALVDLWTMMNQTGDAWGLIQSDPIGRSKYYKEQYVFLYRVSKVRLVDVYLLPDQADDYEREPYCAEFEYHSMTPNAKRKVVFLALHTRPEDTFEELGKLPDSIREAAGHFPQAGGLVTMGDLNADCTYATARERDQLEIFTSSAFTSLIPSSADTTTSGSHCAYDRAFAYGNDIRPRDGQVFDYQAALGLSDDETTDISDHFPIEFKLF